MNVSVVEPELLMVLELKLAVMPGGNPSTLKEALPEKPFVPVSVTATVALVPVMMLWVAGDSEIKKSLTGLISSSVGGG